MKHYMKLMDDPFKRILSGDKSVEIRLYDEKRRKIKEGDIIEFRNIDTAETLNVKVIKLYVFDSFNELFNKLDSSKFGCDIETLNNLIYKIYTKEEEKEYGVVGIEIKAMGDE